MYGVTRLQIYGSDVSNTFFEKIVTSPIFNFWKSLILDCWARSTIPLEKESFTVNVVVFLGICTWRHQLQIITPSNTTCQLCLILLTVFCNFFLPLWKYDTDKNCSYAIWIKIYVLNTSQLLIWFKNFLFFHYSDSDNVNSINELIHRLTNQTLICEFIYTFTYYLGSTANMIVTVNMI